MRASSVLATTTAALVCASAGVISQVRFTNFVAPTPPIPSSVQQVQVADYNNDGFADLSVIDIGTGLAIYLNDKSGGYKAGANVTFFGGFDHQVADFDGDGDLDILASDTSSATRSLRLFLGDGRGNLTAAPVTRLPSVTGALFSRVADLDRDGDIDIVTDAGSTFVVLENRNGTFVDDSARVLRQTAVGTHEIHDVDRDGRLDLVAHSGTDIVILLQDAAGNFGASTRLIPLADAVDTLALGDVDKDGDTEIFAGALFGKDYYFEANGLTWTDATALRMPPTRRRSSLRAARFADIDEDGDLDLVIPKTGVGALQDRTRIYVNDGAGNFQDVTTAVLTAPGTVTGQVLIDDFDGDGDIDIGYFAYANGSAQLVIEQNGMRQCAPPASAKIGTRLDIDFLAHAGFAPPGQLSIPLLAFRVATRTIPVLDFGELGLDLGTIHVWGTIPHVLTTGKATIGLQIPNNSAFSGLRVWSQGLTFQSKRLHFSNVQSTAITL